MYQLNEEYLYQQELQRNQQKTSNDISKNKASEIIKIGEITQEIEVSRVTMLLRFILILSIIADLFGLIPVVGSIFGIFFAILFFILYFINGLGRGMIKGSTRKVVRKLGTTWILRIFFLSAEGVPILGILPFFTIMALVEIVLSQKKVKKLINKIEAIKSKLK